MKTPERILIIKASRLTSIVDVFTKLDSLTVPKAIDIINKGLHRCLLDDEPAHKAAHELEILIGEDNSMTEPCLDIIMTARRAVFVTKVYITELAKRHSIPCTYYVKIEGDSLMEGRIDDNHAAAYIRFSHTPFYY